ncbi:4Fe-4S dicluster domain-containing protein [Dysgonomonas sp. Marseille-P4677]|uniref:4Fe-4S binding protein n=1 Tax=Dysgonomonas sp. Marseille-P4677 TaxID=2364790 RepID=UPI0019127AA8|nr:4Fe-4S binding protein [Dysgonomonas sp. Marseille-P4677]MBK5722791.1 4Fe-4S dicluster domain-containing protein [Dysgonomonas sp. Marseille-P4677]
MLRKIRVTLAIICFILTAFLFLDFTGTFHAWLGWLAKIQFVPALLALNVGLVLSLILLTFFFGRVYCSVICPLGVFQDTISWVAAKRKKNRFSYSPAIPWLRYVVLVLFILSLILGISSVFTLLEPYSAFGRMMSTLVAPLYQLGNNALAYFAERMDSYAFYSYDILLKSTIIISISGITLIALVVLAWRNGRTYCNTICPVGTVLGFISYFSLFRPVFNLEKCNGCGSCARNCKASCINQKTHTIDYSRCVTCLNCIEKCNKSAITYAPRKINFKKKTEISQDTVLSMRKDDSSRRSFLSISTLFALTSVLKAQEKKVDGGLAVIEDKIMPNRDTAIVPPGALSLRNMAQHCTACQLCISVCPNKVLQPSDSLTKFMQPEMTFERGYCRPECIKCSEVCPTSAINLISKADKSAIQVGHAVWIKKNCVVLTDGVSCGNCARHCPTSAIQMVPSDSEKADSAKIPVVNVERCIGCGACENLCPARPFSAIYVEGHQMHRII